jgi:TonB family protein
VSLRRVVRTLFKPFLFLAFFATLFAGFPRSINAQDAAERKVKSKISPLYPEIARKMNLSGVVRLELVVAPNGTIKDTKVIGGNPILVNAAVDAVKKWRFEPASEESTIVKEFKFDPSSN